MMGRGSIVNVFPLSVGRVMGVRKGESCGKVFVCGRGENDEPWTPRPRVEIGGRPPDGMLVDGACITRGEGSEDGIWEGVRGE